MSLSSGKNSHKLRSNVFDGTEILFTGALTIIRDKQNIANYTNFSKFSKHCYVLLYVYLGFYNKLIHQIVLKLNFRPLSLYLFLYIC